MTPLMLVAQLSSQAGAAEVVLRLANADADVNARDWVGQTAAGIAFAKGTPKCSSSCAP